METITIKKTLHNSMKQCIAEKNSRHFALENILISNKTVTATDGKMAIIAENNTDFEPGSYQILKAEKVLKEYVTLYLNKVDVQFPDMEKLRMSKDFLAETKSFRLGIDPKDSISISKMCITIYDKFKVAIDYNLLKRMMPGTYTVCKGKKYNNAIYFYGDSSIEYFIMPFTMD